MIITIVIVLIIALIIVAIGVNAAQQHKSKVDAERRQETAKHKAVIEETEDILMNTANIPMSSNLVMILHKRIFDAIKSMSELNPESKELANRLQDAKQVLENPDPNAAQESKSDAIAMPDNDKQIIAMLQGIKKLRTILRSEHSKGKLDTQVFMNEEKRLERIQLRINVDSQMKRGKAALSSGMVGSARQYLEKALTTLESQTYSDDYISSRKAECEEILSRIADDLKNANKAAREKKEESEKDELDELFAPKKKW
ncbi:hypothetical protein [Algicola sagamiensis]|uniref:hypothetical protein n=1 Tax=Algicola sagamiensis TaxID=163869 RepID=UPI000375726A|nr:hypothetical protein [Algicola sagamiensis]